MVWLLLKSPVSPGPSAVPLTRDELTHSSGRSVCEGIVLAGPGRADVYLNPGRLAVGSLSYQQLEAQFCLRRVRSVHQSVCDAELAHDDRPGFILSMQGEFRDGAGTRYDSGVVFCDAMRPV